MTKPYVVQKETEVGSPPHTFITYWYGRGTTGGTIYASEPNEIATFTSRDQAGRALRKVFGSLAEAKRRGYHIIRKSQCQCTSKVISRDVTTECTLPAFHVYEELLHSDGESKWGPVR